MFFSAHFKKIQATILLIHSVYVKLYRWNKCVNILYNFSSAIVKNTRINNILNKFQTGGI